MNDAAEIIQHVREIAQENPLFVYEITDEGEHSCVYRNQDGSPSCIIGKAMDRAGVLPPLKKISLDNTSQVEQVLDAWRIEHTERQSDWLSVVQEHQDDSATWGEAVATADRVYPL